MEQTEKNSKAHEQIAVKNKSSQSMGVESIMLTRSVIGFVLRGEKRIYDRDRYYLVSQGDVFFLGQGAHYVEDLPVNGGLFEQMLFYYTPEQMQQIIATLGNTSDIPTQNSHDCNMCIDANIAIFTPSRIIRNLFLGASTHYDYGGFRDDENAERLELMQIVHAIFRSEEKCFIEKFMESLDLGRVEFEKVIYRNLLVDKRLEELASESSRSLTSFKKEFKRLFNVSPHRWYLDQRMRHARLLLNTTDESVSQIGSTCAFANTSHFIKLYKRFFGVTPSTHRNQMRRGEEMTQETSASFVAENESEREAQA